MAKELKLMKGNQAIAEAAIRCGCDGYFGYPITPQSEVLEHLMAERPYLTTGMVVLQAESELDVKFSTGVKISHETRSQDWLSPGKSSKVYTWLLT